MLAPTYLLYAFYKNGDMDSLKTWQECSCQVFHWKGYSAIGFISISKGS